MYHIKLTARAQKELKATRKLYFLAISTVIDDLRDDPFQGKPLNLNLSGKYAYKVGTYRIIYSVIKKDKIVKIFSVGHRSTIYQ